MIMDKIAINSEKDLKYIGAFFAIFKRLRQAQAQARVDLTGSDTNRPGPALTTQLAHVGTYRLR